MGISRNAYLWYVCMVAAATMILYGYDSSTFNAVQGSANWKEYFHDPVSHPKARIDIHLKVPSASTITMFCDYNLTKISGSKRHRLGEHRIHRWWNYLRYEMKQGTGTSICFTGFICHRCLLFCPDCQQMGSQVGHHGWMFHCYRGNFYLDIHTPQHWRLYRGSSTCWYRSRHCFTSWPCLHQRVNSIGYPGNNHEFLANELQCWEFYGLLGIFVEPW